MSKSQVFTTAASTAIGGGSIIFLLAHPVGSAVLGGVLVSVNSYFLMKKIFPNKSKQTKS
jgi:hypothetical protein